MMFSLSKWIRRNFKAALVIAPVLTVGSPVFCVSDAVALDGEPPFEDIVLIETLPTRQIVFGYDRDQDGSVDYRVYRALLEFVPLGRPCADADAR